MESPQANNKTKTGTIVALAFVSIGALGSASYMYIHANELAQLAQQERTAKEQAVSEQRIALDALGTKGSLLDAAGQEKLEAQAHITELERMLKDAEARAAAIARGSGRNSKLENEIADLKKSSQQLRDQLASARATELDLRAAADRANAEREALAHKLDQKSAAVRLVNNAEIAALKGRKGKLTVKARRTNEMQMAFDLPEAMATGARFKITAPDGKEYEGADPAISIGKDLSDATANAGGSSAPISSSRTSRVGLKFKTKEKLGSGVYRIDISSGKDYLQTVYLNLR